MAQNAFRFPETFINDVPIDRAFGPPLQAAGNLTYIEFISVVKLLWENANPSIPIFATQPGTYPTYPCIVYGLELRKAHTTEPKPRSRNIVEKNIMVYGQKFQNVVSFTIVSKVIDNEGQITTNKGAELADTIAEAFEDFMLEYTPVFKRLGAAEFVYARRLADSEENRNNVDVVKRTVTYMLTTEKLIATSVDTIEKIAIDVRTHIAYEKELLITSLEKATPDFTNTEVNVVDLYQTATPQFNS